MIEWGQQLEDGRTEGVVLFKRDRKPEATTFVEGALGTENQGIELCKIFRVRLLNEDVLPIFWLGSMVF